MVLYCHLSPSLAHTHTHMHITYYGGPCSLPIFGTARNSVLQNSKLRAARFKILNFWIRNSYCKLFTMARCTGHRILYGPVLRATCKLRMRRWVLALSTFAHAHASNGAYESRAFVLDRATSACALSIWSISPTCQYGYTCICVNSRWCSQKATSTSSKLQVSQANLLRIKTSVLFFPAFLVQPVAIPSLQWSEWRCFRPAHNVYFPSSRGRSWPSMMWKKRRAERYYFIVWGDEPFDTRCATYQDKRFSDMGRGWTPASA